MELRRPRRGVHFDAARAPHPQSPSTPCISLCIGSRLHESGSVSRNYAASTDLPCSDVGAGVRGMRFVRGIFYLMMGSMAIALGAESWHTTHGETFAGKLTGVYGTIAVIAEKKASSMVSLENLGDDELSRVADFLAARSTAPAWKESNGKVAKAVKGRLQVLRNGKLVDFDPGIRRDPEFYLVYFGANWCPPCRAFSPTLV